MFGCLRGVQDAVGSMLKLPMLLVSIHATLIQQLSDRVPSALSACASPYDLCGRVFLKGL